MLKLEELPREPLVSVLVPVFNMAHYIGDALDSVARSVYRRWECLVVDDGSTDGTAGVVIAHPLYGRRIRLIQKANEGPLSCLDVGAEHLRGDIVCLLDADDLVTPDRLWRIVRTFREQPAAGFLVHRLAVCDEGLRIMGTSPVAGRLPEGDLSGEVLATRHGAANLGVSSGFALRAQVFRDLFPAPARSARQHDEYIRRAAPLVTHVAAIDAVLGVRRIHRTSLTGRRHRSLAATVEAHRVQLERHAAALTEFARRRGLLAGLAADEHDLDRLSLTWVSQRLAGAPGWRQAWRAFSRAPGFALIPPARRTFWRCARFAPQPVFRRLVDTLYRSDRLKVLVNYAAMHRRRPVRLPRRNRASLAAVVRFALAGPPAPDHHVGLPARPPVPGGTMTAAVGSLRRAAGPR